MLPFLRRLWAINSFKGAVNFCPLNGQLVKTSFRASLSRRPSLVLRNRYLIADKRKLLLITVNGTLPDYSRNLYCLSVVLLLLPLAACLSLLDSVTHFSENASRYIDPRVDETVWWNGVKSTIFSWNNSINCSKCRIWTQEKCHLQCLEVELTKNACLWQMKFGIAQWFKSSSCFWKMAT